MEAKRTEEHKRYSDAQLAQVLVDTLIERGMHPDHSFTAAAGRAYGYVNAWDIQGSYQCLQGYAICYGDSVTVHYDMADSIENLWEWLIPNDMDVALKAEREANVRGIDKIEAVGANHSGPFAVIVTKYFGDNTQRSKLACDPEYNLRTFASYAEAKSWITSAKREPYSLTRHERCFPDFTIVAA